MMSSLIKAASSKLHDRIEVIPLSSRANPPLLFVYGTLQSGFPNRWARLLASSADFLGPAKVRGVLYQVAHYPGLKPSRGWVEGELYRLRNPSKILIALDRWEGTLFQRVLTKAYKDGSASRTSWVYLFTGRVLRERRILSGKFPDRTS
jgi:gamma-glutamylcyclotransferase (GGCT)/AIG2-like uncharacterized protein YtfP